MLISENLARQKGGRVLFRELSFGLLPGSICHVRGKNGSGKTTLLRTLAGLERAEQGQVSWQGESIEKNSAFENAVLYIGHRSALKPELTVRQNISFWAECYDTAMLTEAALAFFDLKKMEHIACGNLSAGWQQRVALARLVAVPAKLWLLDEPFNHLDDDGAERLNTLIAGRANQQGMVVMSGHGESKISPVQDLWLEDFVV